jgi:hypothetical protein
MFTLLLVSQAGVVSSAARESSDSQLLSEVSVAADNINITGPITATEGTSVTYTIMYTDVVATGGVMYEIAGIDPMSMTVSASIEPSKTYTDGTYVWAYEDISSTGTITLDVTHNDCGSISHTASTLDTHDDPFDNTLQESSVSTLIDCGEEPPKPTTCQGVTVTVNSVASGNWDDPAIWNNGVPEDDDVVWIQATHVITGSKTWTNVGSLCNDGTLQSHTYRALLIRANGFVVNSQNAQILGQDGVSADDDSSCGTRGSTVQIGPDPSDRDGVEITNHGIIQAGNGGKGTCSGLGGSVALLGRNTTNSATGEIRSGNGGNLTGDVNNRVARDGGNIFIFGNFKGSGTLTNEGTIWSGQGGDGSSTATNDQHGGDGGCIILISQPFVNIFGPIIAGSGGMGVNGGRNGDYGCVIIDPEGYMKFSADAKVTGGDIQINGGDNWTVDMSGINTPIITATNSITVAVGDGGVIDLTDNETTVLRAGEDITFYAGEEGRIDESLRLDDNVNINDVADDSDDKVATEASRILRDIGVAAPEVMPGVSGTKLDIDIVIQNQSVASDTISIAVADSENWGVTASAGEVAVAALSGEDVVLSITPQAGSTADRTTITVTITSQEDPTLVVTQEIEVLVDVDVPTAVTLTDADAIAGANWYLPALALLLVAGLLLASRRLVLVARQK